MAVITPNAGSATRYLYEPYGEQIRSWTDLNPGTANSVGTETSAATPSGDYNPWRYASGYYDGQTGFLKFGARYYMPSFETWTQSDPAIGQVRNPLTLNQYAYSGSDPINATDVTGRFWGEDALDDTCDFVQGASGYISGCAAGAGISAEAAAPIAFTTSAIIGPEAAPVVEVSALVGGCAGGLALVYIGGDSSLDVPTVP